MTANKRLVASGIAVLLAVGCPLAFAYDEFSGSNLRITPNAAHVVSRTTTVTSYAQDNVSLRGHLSTIPKGTIMMIKIDQPLNSSSSKVGDPVLATIEGDVFADNQIAIPAGSQLEGTVASVAPAGRVGKAGAMEIQFHSVKTTYGNTLPIRAHIVTDDQTGILKGDTDQARVMRTVGTAAGATAAGTIIGTAAGSILGSAASGAAFGVAAGGLAGVGYAIMREGSQVVVPSGARMSIILDQPVAVN